MFNRDSVEMFALLPLRAILPIVCVWVLLLYAVPLLRIICARVHFPASRRRDFFASVVGRFEWTVMWCRDGLLRWIALVWCVVELLRDQFLFDKILAGVFFIALQLGAMLVRWWHNRWLVQLARWVEQHPNVHPQEVFSRYFRGFAPCAPPLPAKPQCELAGAVLDFRTGRAPRWKFWPVLHGVASTAFVAQMTIACARAEKNPQVRMRLCDVISALWGRRCVQLARLCLRVEGGELARAIDGPVIQFCNHESTLDFLLAPCAFALAEWREREPLHLRYMAAKDHFIDNWFLYRGIRLGQALEHAGVVFVNRKGTPAERQQAVLDSAASLEHAGVDIGIYPQGTRAERRVDAQRVPIAPGYFTTTRARDPFAWRPRAHLKRGVAKLALAFARHLHAHGAHTRLWMMPTVIDGAGAMYPKGALRILTEQTIVMRIGTPWVVEEASLPRADMAPSHTENSAEQNRCEDALLDRIDRAMLDLLDLRPRLARELLTDLAAPRDVGDALAPEVATKLRTLCARATWSDAELALIDRVLQLPRPLTSAMLTNIALTLVV